MDQVLDIYHSYKTYIVRGVVGAILAVLMAVLHLPIWINGAIIALVAGIAGDFVQKQIDAQLENMQAAKNSSDDVEPEAEDAVRRVVGRGKKIN